MLLEIVKHTIMITVFVMVMMLIIEYLTVQTKGKWSLPLRKNSWLQILFAGIMGLIPGCLGTFMIVSLYSHRILNFAALVTVMIATSGDEAFVMFSMIPEKALIIMGIVFIIAIIVGFVLNIFFKDKNLMLSTNNHYKIHKHEENCICYEPKGIIPQLRNISFQRAILIISSVIIISLLITGDIGASHEYKSLSKTESITNEHNHSHDDNSEHKHSNKFGWERITFLIVSFISLLIIITVPDHFLHHHLWEHIVLKHFLKIFLWTFGAFFFIHILNDYMNVNEWIQSNVIYILILAVIIGLIPESGPHIVFISLFISGAIPFSVLLANSIVQDGHGSIPLLAESQKSFIVMKAINLIVGLLVGLIGVYFRF